MVIEGIEVLAARASQRKSNRTNTDLCRSLQMMTEHMATRFFHLQGIKKNNFESIELEQKMARKIKINTFIN